MPRIISGFAGSLTLKAPAAGTRPTSDRVREAMFSALESRGVLRRANVLDLYAGSGALGLEAVSRGAASAVFVEQNFQATAAIRQNIQALERAAPKAASPRMRVVPKSVRAFIEGMQQAGTARFDLVFIDPPYDLDDRVVHDDVALLATRVAAGAMLVIERSGRSAAPVWPAGIAFDRSRTYGETVVHSVTAVGAPEAHDAELRLMQERAAD